MLVQQLPPVPSFLEREKRVQGFSHKSMPSCFMDEECKQRFTAKYRINEPNFATGSYGSVAKAEDKTGTPVIVKIIQAKSTPKWVQSECTAGKLLKGHSNIVQYREAFHTTNFHYLVFDLVSGMDLFSFMEERRFNPLQEDECASLFKQLLKAVASAHQIGIAHRDLKLENIMIDNQMKLTILDFGLCAINNPPQPDFLSEEYVGSENYTAPEIFMKKPYCPFKADIWSLGIILFTLLYARFPWSDISAKLDMFPDGPKVSFPRTNEVSDSVKDLLIKMLCISPSKRIALEEILEHDWLKNKQI